MIKNECEIVKDLIPNYLEETLSNSTIEFIENHINNCTNCKNILEEIEKEKSKETSQEVSEDNCEIDYLKKYNRKLRILEYLMAILVVIVIAIWSIVSVKYKIGEYNHNIIASAYDKFQELRNEENFSYIREATYQNKNNDFKEYFYYKDRKFKSIRTSIEEIGEVEEWTDYGFVTEGYSSYIQFYNFNEDKTAGGRTNEMGNRKDKQTQCCFLDYFYNLGIIESASLEIRNDTYNGKECYVVRRNEDNNQYSEMWIERESMIVIREISKRIDNEWDYNYIWTIGNVTDEDVMLKETKMDGRDYYNYIQNYSLAE